MVVHEVILDDIGLVSQAKNKILVSKMGVILHHVPQNGAVPDRYHGFWNLLRVLAQPHPLPAAKQDNFHENVD